MKNRILLIAVLLVIVVLGLWMALSGRNAEQVDLVPAWLLTPHGTYAADAILDPALSWSPDSKSLLLAAKSLRTSRPWILHWSVGEKHLKRVTLGESPNYTDNETFLYVIPNPIKLVERNLTTGIDRMVVESFEQVDFWKDITSFSYIPARKTIALRFSTFTRYPEPGLQEVDLTGKPVGKLPRLNVDGVLDRSTDPDNRQVAEILGELSGKERILRVSSADSGGKGNQVASGDLGAVAWSPDGKFIAFADASEVKLTDPAAADITIVGRFELPSRYEQAPYICRLAWSPDGRYLAAIQVVPNEMGGEMMAYVLDISKLKR